MSKNLLRSLFAIIVALALGAGLIYFYNNRPITVDVAKVEQNVPIQVFGLGTVEAQVVSTIGFEVGAALTSLSADHGSRVKTGDTLATLHAGEQEAKLERAMAGKQSSDAVLVRTAAMVDKQAAVLAQKQLINRRQQELVKKNAVSIERAEEAAKDVKVAEADLALANADAAVARAANATASADLSFEKTMLLHHSLKAPFDGVIVQRHKELGSVVKAGDPVYTLVDPTSVWILAHVEELRAGAITLGQTAEVQLRSLPGRKFAGQVARIGIESDRISEERRVWVKCQDCPTDFHLGEQAEVIVTTGVLPSALLVPELMISDYDGNAGTTWIVQNGKAARAKVKIGQRTLDGRLEIIGELPEGSHVLLSQPAGLRVGRALTVSDSPKP